MNGCRGHSDRPAPWTGRLQSDPQQAPIGVDARFRPVIGAPAPIPRIPPPGRRARPTHPTEVVPRRPGHRGYPYSGGRPTADPPSRRSKPRVPSARHRPGAPVLDLAPQPPPPEGRLAPLPACGRASVRGRQPLRWLGSSAGGRRPRDFYSGSLIAGLREREGRSGDRPNQPDLERGSLTVGEPPNLESDPGRAHAPSALSCLRDAAVETRWRPSRGELGTRVLHPSSGFWYRCRP
jgi:hypothetical protein